MSTNMNTTNDANPEQTPMLASETKETLNREFNRLSQQRTHVRHRRVDMQQRLLIMANEFARLDAEEYDISISLARLQMQTYHALSNDGKEVKQLTSVTAECLRPPTHGRLLDGDGGATTHGRASSGSLQELADVRTQPSLEKAGCRGQLPIPKPDGESTEESQPRSKRHRGF